MKMKAKARGRGGKVVTRDPERTRGKILQAAIREFAAKGYAGARVDAIARQAAINKRMLYHYFGDKRGLFLAVLRLKISERRTLIETAPDDTAETLALRFQLACRDTDWTRMLKWESLEASQKLEDEPGRLKVIAAVLDRIRHQQAAGQLEPSFDPRHVLLAMLSLTIYPAAFPQITRLVTGHAPTAARFQRDYEGFLRRLAPAFNPGRAFASAIPIKVKR